MTEDETGVESLEESLEVWLASRPQVVRDLARSHPPDGVYRLASGADEDLYTIYSYNENGTMMVTRYMQLDGQALPMWNVFGMKPEDLVRVDDV